MTAITKPKRIIIPLVSFLLALSGACPSLAQEEEASDPTDEIENLFSQEEQKPLATTPVETNKKPMEEIKDVSDLGKLSEFSDIAVIQKRYLPKTKRFELFVGPSFLTNDPFFLVFGLNARMAYYLSERYGAEFVAFGLTSTQREVTKDLSDKRAVGTSTIVSPKAYYGLDFKWVPVYGKQTWLNKKITPFDLYFSAGLGVTQTNQSESPVTLHLGTGQAFAMSKAMAFRWDFSWNFFQAKGSAVSSSTSLYNNLFLTAGFSFFFPEANYR